jgi:glycosyltransferase involved in cell wall biosynthesis
MRVLFLTNGPLEHPPSRHRVYQYLDFLRNSGVEAVVSPGLSPEEYAQFWGTARRTVGRALKVNLLTAKQRTHDVLRCHDFDVVVIQRNILSTFLPIFELGLCRLHPAVILDFDDLIMSQQFAELIPRTGLRQIVFRNRMDRVIRACRHVIVGSPFLLESARPLNRNVTLLPTPVDLKRYTVKQPSKKTDQIVVGWKGGRGTSHYLQQLRPVFDQLAARYEPRLKVIIHGDEDFAPFGPYMDVHGFDLETEIAELHNFDIGVMPLTDDDYTRGKCAFKAIEYMACGIPAVSSPVGVIKDFINHGENGFLASSQREWFDVLVALIEDLSLRERVGGAGRKTIEKCFSIEATGPQLLETLNVVIDRSIKRGSSDSVVSSC